MTNVGPLLLVLGNDDVVLITVLLVEADVVTSGVGLGDDLNLLSRIESNSANCSIVLEDMDLTMGCFTVVVVLLLDDVIIEVVTTVVEAADEAAAGVMAVAVAAAEEGVVVIPKACGGTVTKRLPCLIIHRPVALWTSTCLSPQC